MNRNKHLLLWSSLGVLALLITAAVQENLLKDWRQIQASASTETGPLPVRLRQVVVPKLQVADRCVSCHVGMAPGEPALTGEAVLGAHKPVGHDPAQFGCTVCHGGQGRATEKADAHGDVHFWPQPMIPVEYAQAGCGSCHTYAGIPERSQLDRGQAILERYDCLACHRIDGRGGTLRTAGADGMEGPDLSAIGLTGYSPEWYQKHSDEHGRAAEGAWKTAFGSIDDADRSGLEAFLNTRVGAAQLVEAKSLFHSLGCRGCHKVGGVGGDDGPDLTLAGLKDPAQLKFSGVDGKHTVANWHAEHLRRPAKVVPGSLMPDMGLPDRQIDTLTLYILSLRRGDYPGAYWPQDRVRTEQLAEREFATDGATIFSTFCSGCHGEKGQGNRYPGQPYFPSVGNPDFHAVASDDFIRETIQRGRPGRRMPAWGEKEGGLRPAEIDAVLAHLRELGGTEPAADRQPTPPVEGDVALGTQLYTAHCAGCHGASGEGTEAPALNNAVLLAAASDDYLTETIGRGRGGTLMPGFRTASTTRPALSPAEINAIVAFIRTWEEQQHGK